MTKHAGVAPERRREEGQDGAPTAAVMPASPGRSATGATPVLYHFTCDHSVTEILAVGAVLPHWHPYFPRLVPLAWFTTEPEPERYDVGLTSDTLNCDRMAHRFTVIERGLCVPWTRVRDEVRLDPAKRPAIPKMVLYQFERCRAVESWWVSAYAVPVVLA